MSETVVNRSSLDTRLDVAASILIVAGIAARFYGLDINGYWYDELVSMAGADPSRSFAAVILDTPANAIQPPLFPTILWAWRSLLGDGERVVRLLSVLCVTGAVVFGFVAGRNLMSRSANRMFVTFMACAVGPVVYSQEARPYALLLLLSTVLTLVMLQAIREMEAGSAVSSSTLVSLTVTGVLAAHTHYFALLFAGAVHAVLLIQAYARRLSARGLILAGGTTIGLFAPWLTYELPRKAHMVGSNFWPGSDLGWMFSQMRLWAIYVLGPGSALLAGAVLLRVYRKSCRQGTRVALLSPLASLLMTIVVTWLLAVLVSFHTPLIVARYFLVTAPAALLAAALALEEGRTGYPPSYLLRQAAGLACGALMLIPLANYFKPFKQQYREAARYLQADERCWGKPVLAWRHPNWATTGLAEYRFYMDSGRDVRLVSTDSATVRSIRQGNGDCPMLVWVAHPTTNAPWPQRVAGELQLDLASVEIVHFLGTFVIRERRSSNKP